MSKFVAHRTSLIEDLKAQIYDPMLEISKGLTGVLDLGLGVWSPEYTLPDHIQEASKEPIEKRPRYTHELGLLELRQAIADKMEKENGIRPDPGTEVMVTAGSQEAIFLALCALINPGEEVIMSNPGYISGFEPTIRMLGGNLITVPATEERGFRVDPGEIEEKVTPRTKAIVVITPDNPTGAVYGKSDLEAVAEIAKRHDLLVVSDEIYEKIIFDGRKHHSIASLPGMEERTITINGFSKSYAMEGYRIGYVVGHETFIKAMSKIHMRIVFSISEVAQRAALAVLTGPQDWIKDGVREYQVRRNLLVKGLTSIGGIRCIKSEGTMYLFPNIKEFGMSSFEFAKYILKEARVVTRPGSPLFGNNGEGYLRMVFSRPREMLIEAISRMKEALEKL